MDTEPPIKKPMNKAAKTAITVAVAAFVLLILLAGAGVAYTYFAGSSTPKLAAAPAAAKPQTTIPNKPKTYADDAVVGVSVQSLSTPVAPGSNSYIAIKTLPTATCTIDVEYNKVKSTDTGLVQKTADEYGVTSWSWTVAATTPLGSWPVTVTCVHGSKSAVVVGTLVVALPTDT